MTSGGPAGLSVSRKLGLAGEILSAYVRVRWLLWRRGLPSTLAALRPTEPPGVVTGFDQHPLALRLGRAVVRVLRLLPADSRCLMRSLVLTVLLARRGIGTSLVIGVRTEPFAAHAWVEHAGEPLLQPAEAPFRRLLEV